MTSKTYQKPLVKDVLTRKEIEIIKFQINHSNLCILSEANTPYNLPEHCTLWVFFTFLHIRFHGFYTDAMSSEQPSYLEIMPC